MQHRTTDDGSIRIKREVPLWGVLSALGIVAAQAVALVLEQRAQGQSIATIQTELPLLRGQLEGLNRELGVKNIKDVEHDLKLADHERRIGNIETTLKTIGRAP